MKYVWMLTDSASDHEPPELFSSKKRGILRMCELFEETLDNFITELPEEIKESYRKDFRREHMMYFNLCEERDGFPHRLIWARSCSLDKVWVK